MRNEPRGYYRNVFETFCFLGVDWYSPKTRNWITMTEFKMGRWEAFFNTIFKRKDWRLD